MQPLGNVLKTLMPGLTSVSEVERYICSGCGNEVVVIEAPIIGGPNKGKITRGKRGCKCWEYEQAREAKLRHQELQIEYMINRYSTVNPELENACFENYERLSPNLEHAYSTAYKYVQEFSLDKPINLLFSGMYGLGKSHLAYSVCKELREKGLVAVFISVPKLLTIIKSTYHDDSDYTEAELLDVLSKVDFLALDDIGAEKVRREEEGDSWATEKLFEIIDGRSGRHTLYTTNLTSEDLRRKVGPRNFSRMMANTKPLKFEGEDYRIKNKRF
ncbi:ATP-binding protein [Paenibacillus alvei]|uniref:ATP-binding protein n=3 Tax=Paenibacillus alvei TaxID=44250 RepID=A0ABT4H892_PAEAL|nr:ATP-binding protein [Paenibacillus alvei]EJW19037.1 DnaC phage replication protein [Paenibacillus alvei DSM 29]MCY9539194.1 ATP-binding protein [Paenibacillus alvei]MCY9738120.1 ATP-binding protein [Paenibacillus alvei]MCY9765206.1 ATP-binding protein [Paenibacillus alvei]MCY9767849.1 ATP-binding protein [Paenibacillus alvei]